MTPYESVIDALEAIGLEGIPSIRGGSMFQCPAHDDERASLSVGEGDEGSALLYCFAGCGTEDVVKALGLEWEDLFRTLDRVPATYYVYEQKDGTPHIRVTRYVPKGFTQEHWDGSRWVSGLNGVERVPYRLPELLDSEGPIYVTEGEKDADTLAALGLRATTFLGGAGKWRDEYASWFQGVEVVLVADADDAGRAGAEAIAARLRLVARDVRVVVPKVGKDATDHVRAGFGPEEFVDEGAGLDEFGPLDWEHYEVEKTEWLLEPYVPRGGRVLAYGPKGSLKSLWSMWLASKVAQDGGRVAYFSLEMLVSDTVRRVKVLNPPKDRFLCFTKGLKLGSPSQREKLIRGLRDFDLIVVDSWTAARAGMKDSAEQIAELDVEFFLPLIRHTGAAIMLLDNTGHAAITDRGIVKPDHARGSSAKGDKVDVEIQFERPFEDNNYLTTITCRKMRLDYPWPKPVTVMTPTGNIEFFFAEIRDNSATPGRPMWPGLDVGEKPAEVTPYDELAEARLRDRFASI